MEAETQPSTMPYYQEKRQELIDQLGGQCEWDGCQRTDPRVLQFHHVEPIEEGSREGGWQHLYQLQEELEEGVEIQLLCKNHHVQVHQEREDLEPLTRWTE